MPQPRQIKIKYPNMSEPIYVNSISEAIELSKFTIDAIKDCLSGDRKDIQGITFEYASKTPKDKVTRGIKDSTANLKGRNTGKGVKVTNVETGEVRCFPKRVEALTYMGYKAHNKSLKPYIVSGELAKGKYKLEEWTLEDEEEMYFQRAQTAIDKVESNDIRSKLQGILSQVRYDKYESFNPKQIREILPFKRWIEDAYYSGPDAVKLYPFWKKFLTDVFDSGKNITEAVLAGSIGTGKTTASLYGLMYKLYTLSCYENTAGLFNLMVTSKIAMIYFTISVKQAEKLGYGQLRSMIDSTPYFKDKFPRQDRIQSKLVFPENVEITYGSNNNHAIGLNLIASLLDEANFFKEEADETVVSAVYELYSSIIARGRSRYLHGGWNHSICFLVSSSTHQGSFTEKRINEGRKDNFEHMCVAAPRLWDVKPKGTYSDKRFYVFGGNENIDPLLLDTIQDVNRVRSALFMPLLDSSNVEDACKRTMQELKDELIIPIPIDFRKDFENDIIKGLQDIAGYSTAPSGFLFSSRPMYNKCVDKDYKHPFLQESLCISTNEPEHIWDYLIKGYEFKDKHQPHFISVDASTKHDSTGISMIHLKDIEVDEYGVSKPIIQVDFMLRITPPLKPFEIDIAKIREFIRYLRDEQDINIYGVSYDQYASAESLQLLRQQGFNAIQQSVIRSDVPHKDFVHIIQEGRLITYNYKPFESELFNMQHNRVKHKVFITPGATQYHGDTYMSLIGAFMHLMSVLDELPLTNENLTLGEDFYKDQYEIDTQEIMDSLVDGALNGLMDVDYDDLWDEDDDFIDY